MLNAEDRKKLRKDWELEFRATLTAKIQAWQREHPGATVIGLNSVLEIFLSSLPEGGPR